MIDIIIISLAVLVVAGVIGLTIWRKKHGKTGCGCDCSSCGGACHCHDKKEEKE